MPCFPADSRRRRSCRVSKRLTSKYREEIAAGRINEIFYYSLRGAIFAYERESVLCASVFASHLISTRRALQNTSTVLNVTLGAHQRLYLCASQSIQRINRKKPASWGTRRQLEHRNACYSEAPLKRQKAKKENDKQTKWSCAEIIVCFMHMSESVLAILTIKD